MERKELFVPQFVEILVKNGLISQEEGVVVQKSFADVSQAAFDAFLIEQGIVQRDDLLVALSYYYKVPSFDAHGHFFNHHLLRMFPKSFLLRNVLIPLSRDENMLIVVAAEPDNPYLLSGVGEHVSYDVRFRVGLTIDITDAVSEYYDRALTEVGDGSKEPGSAPGKDTDLPD